MQNLRFRVVWVLFVLKSFLIFAAYNLIGIAILNVNIHFKTI